MRRVVLGVTGLVSVATVWVLAQPAPSPVLALVNGNVVDPRDGRVASRAAVVIRDGKIESVGSTAAPAGAQVLDLAGKYLVPGLIDAHVHIQNLRALRTALESGVTTVRSAGVSSYVDVGMRELVRRGEIVGPDVIAAGYHVRPQLAEEAFFDHPALAQYMHGGVVGADAIREVVRANLSHGVDWIKVLATERAGTADTDPRKQVYTEGELRAAVEEAAAKNVPVEAHAHGDTGAMAAVRAGVRSIEHGTYLSDATLQLMKEKGTYFVPTYTTVVDLTEPGGDYDVPALRVRGQHMLPRLRETVQRAYRLGVKIVTGADTGYGPASLTRISQEVTNFAEMGMKPLDALRAATVVPAEMLRLEGSIGVIAPGFQADMIAVELNPLETPRALQDVLLVVSNGKVALNRLDMTAAAQYQWTRSSPGFLSTSTFISSNSSSILARLTTPLDSRRACRSSGSSSRYWARALTRSSSGMSGGNCRSRRPFDTAASTTSSSRFLMANNRSRSPRETDSRMGSTSARRYGFEFCSAWIRNFVNPRSTMFDRPSVSGSTWVITPAHPIGKTSGRPS